MMQGRRHWRPPHGKARGLRRGVARFKGLRRCRRPRHEGAGAAADLEETATSNPSLQSAGAAKRCKQHGEENA